MILLAASMICTALPLSVYAADTISFEDEDTDISESFEPTDDSTGFDDVQLISTQINNGVMRKSYSVNWTIPANGQHLSTIKATLHEGDYFYFDLEISPNPTGIINIGVLNRTTKVYRSSSVEKSTYTYFLDIKADGEYSVKIKNNTSEDITVTGMYEAVNYYDSTSLSVPLHKQEDTKWCWATCIQMCAEYKGYTATQSEIVEAAKGKVVNEGGSSSDDYAKGMKFATNNVYTAERNETILAVSKIKNILESDMPLMISFGTYKDNKRVKGHANVVTAVDKANRYIRVNDPNYNGASKKNYKYSVITSPTSARRYDVTIQIENT